MKYQFLEKENPVWKDVLEKNSFTNEEFESIKNWWLDYKKEKLEDFDFEASLKEIERHQKNRARLGSHLWRKWGARDSVKTTIDFDYSSTLEMQRNDCKDKSKRISDWEEQDFAAALMCCDTPERTIGFLLACLADEMDMTLSERLDFLPIASAYVNCMMEICFIGKWTIRFPRPSHVEEQIYGITKTRKSVSVIPNPNHPSLGSGHSTVGQAIKMVSKVKYPNLPKAFEQLCDEVGIARITVGIHHFADHRAAIDLVEAHHDLVMSKI